VTPALLVLVTPYTSVERLATEQFPLVPAALLKYPLRTDELIGEVKSPILIAHGDADELIPFDHARQLAAASGKRATLLRVDGARHGDIHQFPAYLAGLSQRMEETASRPAKPRVRCDSRKPDWRQTRLRPSKYLPEVYERAR
jgi:fermentation-respiration switch protein FrsA (DUF1100 family)